MNLFGCQQHNNEHINLHHGIHRRSAADIPPFHEMCKAPHDEEEREKSSKLKFLDALLDDIFDGAMDSDKLLIGAIIYMLIKEGADIKLIIALGYILM